MLQRIELSIVPIQSVLEDTQLKHTKVGSVSLSMEHHDVNYIKTFTKTAPPEKTTIEPFASSKSRFCALAYAPRSGAKVGRLSAAEQVVLLAIEDSGVLKLLVHPNLKSIVDAIDFPYIESLLKDFAERIIYHTTELFCQLCTLAVGPLQVHTVGELCEHPNIQELALQFSILEN